MQDKINSFIDSHQKTIEDFKKQSSLLEMVAQDIIKTFKSGKKLMLCGNGGSAADAQHMAAEFVVRFKINRNALAALSLTTDTSNLTATGNDFDFEHIFSRQIEALGLPGDILLMFSTSGNSKNLVKAVESAKKIGVKTIALLGKDGGVLKDLVDTALVVNASDTARIQEVHSLSMHILCEIVEAECSGGVDNVR